jgi:hypothetical protein
MWRGPEYPGEFPTLGFVVGDWIQQNCVIPTVTGPATCTC